MTGPGLAVFGDLASVECLLNEKTHRRVVRHAVEARDGLDSTVHLHGCLEWIGVPVHLRGCGWHALIVFGRYLTFWHSAE